MRSVAAGGTRSRLFSMRHIGRSVLVALVVSLALGGFFGVASASDRPYDLYGPFEVPLPAVGDRGEYAYSTVQLNESGTHVIRQEVVATGFEWLTTEDILDSQGEPRRTNVLKQFGTTSFLRAHTCESEQWRHARPINYHYDADWTMIATQSQKEYIRPLAQEAPEMVVRLETNPCPKPPVDPERLDGRSVKTTVRDYFGYYPEAWSDRKAIPCLLHHNLQGRSIQLDEPVRLFPKTCQIDTPFISRLDGVTFHAAGREEIADRPCVVFTGESGSIFDTIVRRGRTIHVWLCQDVPYPVRVAIEQFSGDGDRFNVYRLVSFAPGTHPIAQPGETPSLAPGPDLEHAPWKPWGLDDSGVEQLFPLSTAYAHIVSDPSGPAKAFMEENPQAYPLEVGYHENHDDDLLERIWRVAFAGKDRLLPVTLVQTVPVDGSAGVTYRYDTDWEHYDWSSTLIPPDPAHLPDTLPTISSLIEQWRTHASPGFRDLSPNLVGFELTYKENECWSDKEKRDECDDLILSMAVGYKQLLQTDQDYAPVEQSSILRLSNRDRPFGVTGFTEMHSVIVSTWQPPAAVTDDGLSTMSFGSFEPTLWRFPDAKFVIGASIVALLVGFLYWFWPVIKSGLTLPLFSRVDRPAALAHPTRAKIAQLVAARPGIHQREIQRQLELESGTTRHHLQTLERVELLVRTGQGGYACYFPAKTIDRRLMMAAPLLKSEGGRAVLQTVVTRPGLSLFEVAQVSGLTRPTVHHHLYRLEKAQLVTLKRVGRVLRVQPTNIAQGALQTLGYDHRPSTGQVDIGPATSS